MNYYTEHPRLNSFVNQGELMAQGLAMQGSEFAACQKQVGQVSGAYIVAVQMGKDSVY